jgi:alpha-galactosidase
VIRDCRCELRRESRRTTLARMPRPPVLATHPQAGQVELRRLGVRLREVAEVRGVRAQTASELVAGTVPQSGHQAESDWLVFDADQPADGTQMIGTDVGPIELTTHLEASTRPAGHAHVAIRVRNRCDRPVELGSVIVGFDWVGHGVTSHRFLRHGWQSWSYTGTRELGSEGEREFPSGPWLRGMHHAVGETPADRGGFWESDMVTAVGASPSGPVCCVGVLERGESFGVIYLKQQGDRVLVEVELRLDAVLEPNEQRDLEGIWLSLGENATHLLEAYAEELGRTANARTAHPFLAGWCSWYHFFSEVTEDDVLRNLDALVAARDELPVDVVQIDDGYQRQIGDWLETNEKFPRGLAPLAADIRAAGFTAGLWTAPFCVVPESALFGAHPEWLLRDSAGLFRGLLHPTWSSNATVHVLDTTRRDVLEHLESVFSELVGMGFHYQKLDFLYTAAMRCSSAEPGVSRARRLRQGLVAIRDGAGPEAFLLGCGCPLGAAVGVVDGMRIGPDVAPFWEAAPEQVIPGIEAAVPATRSALRSILARAWTHRRLWLNDPDCLMARSTDTGLSSDERGALATAIGITGGMLVFSDDMPKLSSDDRSLIRNTIAIAKSIDELGVPGLAQVPQLLADEIAHEVAVAGPDADYRALINSTDAVRSFDVGTQGSIETLAGSPTRPDNASVELAARSGALFYERREFSLAVFCDFDGTFSIQDVGSTLAIRHAGARRPELWERYGRGEITAWEYNMEVLDGLEVSLATADAFLASVELNPGAIRLLDWCRDRGVPFRVLSDGFDYNLNRLQVIHGVRFAYVANHLHYDAGAWRIRAGAPNPECGCGTGVCKRAQIDAMRARSPGVTTVHIGNGRVSDTCGALAADIAFAKDSLATELETRGVPYTAYESLAEVIPHLERLLPDLPG